MRHRELLNFDILVLTIAQAASVTGTAALITLGGIVGRDLARSPALATLPVSLLVIGTAAATLGAAWLMSRIGRARGFAIGASIGCAGAVLAALALFEASFALFCGAAAMIGVANAFAQQYRFAAVERVSEGAAPLAVSIILAGSLVGAVLGPQLAASGEYWFHETRFAGTFTAIAGCYLASASILLGLRQRTLSIVAESGPARNLREMARSRTFIIAILAAASGYGVMSFVMTATPIAMHISDGHSLQHTSGVIQAHVLAMYAPSLVIGALLQRFGAKPVMLAGALLLCLTVALGFAGREVLHYGASMVALGFGWACLFIGGTTLLGTTHTREERFRAQAVNDFSVFSLSAVGSLAAGVVMQTFGWNAVLFSSLPLTLVAIIALGLLKTPSYRYHHPPESR
ncbi:MAG: MFS transporter [Gammaproteobacteria bacterium]|nr:MFS transporter [Gammaproteobacteria bacterium]